MIKRCLLLVMILVVVLQAITVRAQDVTKSAVKLGAGAVVKNTIIWGNEGTQRSGGTVTTSHIKGENGAADPQFRNAGKGDFRLLSTSPCVNKGTADSRFNAGSLDLWGGKRTIGDVIDIGAHEYTFYKVHFIKSSYVSVIEVDADGNKYDSTLVDPGDKYVFKLVINISGFEDLRVKKVSIIGTGEEIHAENEFYYTISDMNADVTVEIELDPPVTIAVEPTTNGWLKASSGSQVVPVIGGDGKLIYAFQVTENASVKIDTIANEGYYCSKVLVRDDGVNKPSSDAMAYAGNSTYSAVKNVIFDAVFSPRAYPVTTSWNAAGGSVSVKNKKTGLPLFAGNAASPQKVSVDYLTDVEVTATPATGYTLESIKIKKQDGTEIGSAMSNPRQATVQVGGISIVVTFAVNKYTVKWVNPTGGKLLVKNGLTELNSGDKVDQGTIITIVPVVQAGFLLKTLGVVPEGEVAQTPSGPVDGKYSWTVSKNVTLQVQFEQRKLAVTLETNTPDISGNTLATNPALSPIPNNKVIYGSSLDVIATPTTGYRCDGITVNGVKMTDAGRYNIQNIIEDKAVKAWFSRKPYTVNFNTPEHGTLLVEVQTEGMGAWKAVNNGATVYHFDRLRVTGTPKTGYKTKILTVNGSAFTSGTTAQIEGNQTIFAEFEPETYAVHVVKEIADPSATPEKGIIILTNQATGTEIIRLGKSETTATKLNIPYGTIISVGTECDESYNVTALDTATVGTPSGDILARRSFKVTQEVTVRALIKQTSERYTVNWSVEQPPGSSNKLFVYKTVVGDVNQGMDFPSGMLLNVRPLSANGDICLYVRDQNKNLVSSPYSLSGNVILCAKFVKACTVRIQSPAYADIIVKKDGAILADGAIIPAGSVLNVEMVVKAENQDSVRCGSLTGEGRPVWTSLETVTTLPVTSGVQNYSISPEHAGGDIVFGGTTGIYYKVRYTPALHGTLQVNQGADVLAGDQDYWYEKGTQLNIIAKGEEGYDYKGTFNVVPSPREELGLIPGGAEEYFGVMRLAKHMDIVSEFELRYLQVTLRVKPSGLAGVVAVNDRGTDILSADGATVQVAYGTNLTIHATPSVGYLLSTIKGGENLLGTTTGTLVRVTQDSVITVTFGHQYQVIFDENQLTVKHGNVELSNGDYVVEGMELVASYTGNLNEGVECKKITAEWAVGSSVILPLDGKLTMPPADVTLSATTGLKEYVLTYSVAPVAYGTISVVNVTKGEVPLMPGDLVTHGDVLKTMVHLSPDLTGLMPTWYYVKNIQGTVNGETPVLLLDFSGLNGLIYTAKNIDATGDIHIHADLERKTNKLYVKVEPQNQGFAVEVEVNGTVTRFTNNGNIDIPVGTEFVAKPIIPADKAEGYELGFFPDVSMKLESYTRRMPDELLRINAQFDLKKFKVLVDVVPVNGGHVLIKDNLNHSYINNSDIVYGTNLNEIRVAVSNRYFGLKKLEAVMKGSDQLAGQSPDDYHIKVVTDMVKFRAEFERLYKITNSEPKHGQLAVTREDTSALEMYYPAGTELKLNLTPDKGYEVSALRVNGVSVSDKIPSAGGEVKYVIPDDNAVNDLQFEVLYVLKKVKVKFIASGSGSMGIDGLPGGHIEVENKNVVRDVNYFTELSLSVVPKSESYRVSKFLIHLEDGTQVEVSEMETVIQVEGNTTIEVEFVKYYRIIYTQPDHGKLIVERDGKEIASDFMCPGGSTLGVRVEEEEGYTLDLLTWNENVVMNNSVILPPDALYDVVEIVARMKIKKVELSVEQPEGGTIFVEKFGLKGWETLDVSVPLVLDYWTKIRAKVVLNQPDQYIVSDLTVNAETSIAELEEWTMKGNALINARIVPRVYSVTYVQPEHGRLEVTTEEGDVVENGAEVPYLTRLVVKVTENDPVGYHIGGLLINETEVENETSWLVESDVTISATIVINRWKVARFVKGEGILRVVHSDQGELVLPAHNIEHYTKLKIIIEPAEGWLLVSVDADGAEILDDKTFTVEGDVDISVVFRKAEEYKFPVLFTPNGDGYNDTWMISGLWQSPENTLEIFNRAEQRIYKISPYLNDWDGRTDNGKMLPSGSYVYKFTTSDGKVYMGMVSIARD